MSSYKPTDRSALHCYVTDEAHTQWHDAADEFGLTVSAIIEALAPQISMLLEDDETLLKQARSIAGTRRRRTR